ncbi:MULTISPECIES: hypothetical protein [Fictibacillus]|uniref:hypothetical protein n=1 Tax=Fictibacillus TaxID=1329200 RepID=UPI0018CE8205|nr:MULTISPECIES: hypothetical protein [unclassified Fictibacillus]MBH0162323.1 hypothetical protein [Fictibacillus sp. 26RED30]MBH0172319.1 hypothetical protein [Fictibacillus sp. 23RED33]
MALRRRKKKKSNNETYTWVDLIVDLVLVIPELIFWLIRLLGRSVFRLFDGI